MSFTFRICENEIFEEIWLPVKTARTLTQFVEFHRDKTAFSKDLPVNEKKNKWLVSLIKLVGKEITKDVSEMCHFMTPDYLSRSITLGLVIGWFNWVVIKFNSHINLHANNHFACAEVELHIKSNYFGFNYIALDIFT